MTRAHAHTYVALFSAAIAVAVVLAATDRRRIAILQRQYWQWLLVPWKLATVAISALVLVIAGPYSGDCDWDATVSILMSVLTFATAPWAVGELWRRRGAKAMYVALCAWLLSASWSFDLYWFARRGFYPDSWWGNLVASSMLYVAAGVLWNLDWTPEKGWHLGFLRREWLRWRTAAPFKRMAAPALAIMTIVGITLLVPLLFVHE
ncbi:MAG: hypothetical protein JWN44_5034 [Myxococcales bacterium]|nr:hypothetical protein [Myxococcales bacterium]